MLINRKNITSVGFVLFIILYISNANKITNIYIEHQSFEGKIIRKELTSGRQHPIIYLIENNKEQFYDIGNNNIYKIIQPGDYIIKKKNSLYYTLIRNTDTIIFQQ